jgi:hypothetical protein
MTSLPAGAADDVHRAVPLIREAWHKAVVPVLKYTVPVGVPFLAVTFAE